CFSSRRRHTRFSRDWSSDVCSSDLIEVVGQAADGQEAIELTARLHPDIVVMDVRMPGLSGIEATRRIRSQHPDVQVLVLTAHDRSEERRVGNACRWRWAPEQGETAS